MGIYLNNQKNVFLNLLLCLLLISNIVNATTEAEYLYLSGLDLFEKGKFEDSIEKLESAVKLEPNIAKYHHILAKSYGRQAEGSIWFKASRKYVRGFMFSISLASNTFSPSSASLCSLSTWPLSLSLYCSMIFRSG